MKTRHSELDSESQILIFGGTTEGRELAEVLAKNKIECELHVATEYGEQVVENSDLPQNELSLIHIKTGRLSKGEMRELAKTENYKIVVDATHPFATEVSENIREVFCNSEKTDCRVKPDNDNALRHSERSEESLNHVILNEREESVNVLIRLERNLNHIEEKNLFYFDDDEKCALALENLVQKNSDARILLTTGSKNLHVFCRNENLRNNLVARVLPSVESLKICGENKLEGKQIIAMQGPFSQKMNEAQIRDYKIQVLVTKESGHTGGVDEKIEAAKNCGIKCFVIKAKDCRVKSDNDTTVKSCNDTNKECHAELVSASVKNYITHSVRETCECLSKILGKKILSTAKLKISLCGIGMGNPKNLTREVEDAIQNADLIFGARRMIENLETSAKRFSVYLAKDIIPVLKKSQEESFDEIKAAVLFSGDTGFFSGAAKLYAELKTFENAEIKILPGISSMSYLSAKTGINYENAKIISTHGIDEKIWKPELKSALESSLKKDCRVKPDNDTNCESDHDNAEVARHSERSEESVNHVIPSEREESQKSIFFLTSGAEDVQKIGKIAYSVENNRHLHNVFKMILGFNLSYQDEKILELTAEECEKIRDKGLYCGFVIGGKK